MQTELISVYRVGNKYIGCNMQKTSFSRYFKGLVTFIQRSHRSKIIHKLYTSGHQIVL